MNKSEVKGYNWLLSKGYTKNDIVFQARNTPDFLTSDGLGWEVKKVYGRTTIWMTVSQFERIKLMDNTQFIVFTEGIDIPILEIASKKIEVGKIYNGIRLVLPKKTTQQIIISDETMAELKKYNAKKYNGDVYGKITETAEKAIKEYIGNSS